jgi:hypothetical protein
VERRLLSTSSSRRPTLHQMSTSTWPHPLNPPSQRLVYILSCTLAPSRVLSMRISFHYRFTSSDTKTERSLERLQQEHLVEPALLLPTDHHQFLQQQLHLNTAFQHRNKAIKRLYSNITNSLHVYLCLSLTIYFILCPLIVPLFESIN